MRYLRWVGLVSTLLFVGVLGGLMAPLPSEAVPSMPTLTIDGVTITNLQYYGDGCGTVGTPNDPGFNACWSIPSANGLQLPIKILDSAGKVSTEAARINGRQVSNWYIGSYSATNKARVLIFDVSTSGSTDDMKLTGITFTPVTAQSPNRQLDVFLTNTFNQPDGGNLKGNYTWNLGQGGNMDPFPETETTIDSGVQLTGTANNIGDVGTGNLGVLHKYNLIKAPPTPPTPVNTIIVVSESIVVPPVKPPTVKMVSGTDAICNTGKVGSTDRCAPTIMYNYHVTIKGLDILNLVDSLVGCGGSCDNSYGGGQFCDEYGGNCLPSCTNAAFVAQCEDPTAGTIPTSLAAEIAEGIAIGGVEICGSNCILTMVKASPAKKGNVDVGAHLTVTFNASGPGFANPFSVFNVNTNADGIGGHPSKDLDTGPNVGTRTFSIPSYPLGWEAANISCVSLLNKPTTSNPTSNWSINGTGRGVHVEVRTLGDGDILTCTWQLHRGQ